MAGQWPGMMGTVSGPLGMSGLVVLLGVGAAAVLEQCGEEPGDCPACVADFALYDPATEDDGVWEEEVTALEAMFQAYDWTWERVDARALNAGTLGSGTERRYRALIAPGGYAYARDRDLSAAGESAVRAFVDAGGAFVGFCAGTFWAAETVVWAETASGGDGGYNQPVDYQAYDYDLELFPGSATGPLGWAPWEAGLKASLEPAAIDTQNPVMAAIGMPATTRFFYYGGPFYTPREPPDGYEVWARAIAPAGLPADAATGAGEPTIVRYRLGQGTVILFSYHPEILIDSPVDGVELSTYIVEGDVAWETGAQTQAEINGSSWNIVHAALQIAAGEPVTPIDGLP